ncbi:hypothetical protein, partial [Acetomicrobium sp.]|uniref:hypothetical protein n=1 Tax=Acetomicrobium sp. TaxID=1872099 RepID=UPI002FC9A904
KQKGRPFCLFSVRKIANTCLRISPTLAAPSVFAQYSKLCPNIYDLIYNLLLFLRSDAPVDRMTGSVFIFDITR